jgi:alginate biosynthesis protein Alg44
MTNAPNLVHEADAQRHHVRVKLPAKIEISGISYDMVDWSTGGARVQVPANADASVFTDGKVHNVNLIFNLSGFSLTVPMTVEMRHAENGEGGFYIGVRYIDMTKEQIVILQHLVNGYVTGSLTSVDELIHVISRNNFTKPRQVPKRSEEMTAGEKISMFVKKAGVPLVSVLLLAYVFMAVFEQKYVVSAEKAIVTGDALSLTTPAGGIVSFKDLHNGDSVKKGDVVMTVLSDTGTVTGVDSPCDCVIQDRPVDSGMSISKGAVVLRLLPVDAPLRVEAYIPYVDAVRIAKGQKASVQVPGSGDHFSGTITGVTMGIGEAVNAKVIIRPEETLPSDLAGTPVRIKINTAAGQVGE